MNTLSVAQAGGRATIRTVVVRISRKLKATYRFRTGRRFSRLLLALVAAASPLAVRALPQGATVTAGQSSISTPTAGSMVINQGSSKAILDWSSYNIGRGESVRYVQPDASSVSLNRIGGGSASSIYGALSANGQVFLVNPFGVLFAPGAQVNVGGLVATTLAISNDDFLAGRYQFAGGGSGSVVNQGALQGGYVVLAAPQVTNAGTINAPAGAVGLLAGSRVSVDLAGAGLVNFSVDAAAVDAAVSNSGTITADGGKVLLAAQALSDALPTVINQAGVVRANSIAERDGMIVLSGGATGIVAVSGTLEARGANAGETGGTIKVLGDRVGLLTGARVDASGSAGGGTVLVGGNLQGQGPEQNSSVTAVAQGASIDASARDGGNGGTIIVWSDGRTVFAGTGDVSGAGSGGNGGFAEVSGKQSLAYLGTVKAQGGPGGQSGTLLLDPENITVVDNPAQADVNGDGTTGDDLAAATLNATASDGLTSIISNDAVVSQLNAANVTLNARLNIDVDAAIDASANANANRLTLRSTTNGAISINAPITLAAGAPGFTATTSGAGTINVGAAIDSGGGAITLSTAGGIVNLGADLNAGASSVGITGATRLTSARTITAAGTTFTGTLDGDGAAGADSLHLTGNGNFTSTVGATDPLGSLQVDGSSKLAGNVTTTGSQQYTGVATLAGDLTLTSTGAGGNVAFGGAVRGTTAGTEALSVVTTSTGSAQFGGTVGTSAVPLESLTTSGTTSLGGNVQTFAQQAYGGNVKLAADVIATSQNNFNITFGGTVEGSTSGTELLSVTTGGNTSFASTVGAGTALQSLTTSGGGTTFLGGNVTTATGQTYNDAVVLNASTTATSTGSGAIVFNSTVDANNAGVQALTVDTAGITTFATTVGATAALDSVTTQGGGTTKLTGAVRTQNAQTYGDSVVLAGNVVSTSLGGGNISFNSTVKGTTAGAQALTVNTAGDTVFASTVGTGVALDTLATDAGGRTLLGGNVTTANAQAYNDNVVLTADVVAASTGAASVNFNGTVAGNTPGGEKLTVNSGLDIHFASTVGGGNALGALTANAAGSTFLGGDVTTTGAQSYTGPVVLAGNVVAASTGNGAVSFNGTVDGTAAGVQALTVNTGGATTFASTVGSGTALNSLATDAGGTTKLSADVTTQNGQTYGDAVTLAGNVTATSLGNQNVAFNGTVRGAAAGAQALTVNTTGDTVFGSTVGTGSSLASLTTNAGGRTLLGGNVTTASAQSYNDNVVLTANVIAASTGASNIVFAGTVNGSTAGNESLTVNTGGVTSFASTVGAATPLLSLATDAAGSTALGGNVTTAGAQTYNDPVVLNASVTSTSSGAGNISFNGSVNGILSGAQALTVDTGGTTSFGAAVGAATPLASLTTDAGGTTRLAGNVTTATTQGYGDNVTLTGDDVLAGTTVSFAGTVNGTGVGTESLTVSGNGSFAGAVGNTRALDFLSVSGTAGLGGNMSTANNQTYTGAVTLTGDVVAKSTGGGTIQFGSTIDGNHALTVTTSATTAFTNPVGTTTPLASLTVNGGGTTDINTDINAGVQAYTDNVVLSADVTLNGNAVSFAGTVDGTGAGTEALTVNAANTSFAGVVGGGTRLQSLQTSGATSLGGNVTTQDAQLYGGAVTVAANAVLASTGNGSIGFTGSVDGKTGNEDLTVTTAGNTTFGAGAGGTKQLGSLTTNGGGTTLLGGSVRTRNAQTYDDAVTLTANVTASSTGGGAITFGSTVGGAFDLAANTSGATTFSGVVSGLDGLSTDAAGTTVVNGGSITTTGAPGQVFNDAVTLGANTTLNAGAGPITFAKTVDGAFSLAANSSGTTSFGGAVGGGTALTSVSTDAPGTTDLNGGAVTTSAAAGQVFNDAVVLSKNAVLSANGGGAITFASTVNGAFTLAANTTGVTTFGGAVGGTTALKGLSTDAGGSTAISGGAVTTNAGSGQAYGDNVTLGGNTVLSAGTGAIRFDGTVNGNASLTATTSGATTFNGTVGNTALTSLATNGGGTTFVNGGSVKTTGAGGQVYSDAVVLGADTVFDAGTGPINFAGTVNGTFNLAANSTGVTTFGAAVGGTAALSSLTTNAGGSTAINGGAVTTSGAGGQVYNDAVTLGANTLLKAGTGPVTFNGTVNAAAAGGQSLTVTTSGLTSFDAAVGGSAAPSSVTTNGGGTTDLNANVTTTAAQTYTDNVVLTTDVALAGSAVNFAGTVEGTTAGQQSLTTSGATTFGSTVGAGTALEFVRTGGATRLGGNVTTQGAQAYGGDVTLGATSVLASTGNQAISFNGQVNAATAGSQALTVTTSGLTTFTGAVGTSKALGTLDTNGGGSTSLGGNVSTSNAQTYADAVTLQNDVTLTSNASGITMSNGMAGNGHSISLVAPGTTSIASASGLNLLTFAGGTLASTGTLQASTYNLDGGTVSASLGTGTLNARKTSTLTGTSGASTVEVSGGTFTLGPTANRLTAVTQVTVDGGGTLDTGTASQQLGASGNLAAVSNNGTLVVSKEVFARSINSRGVLRTAANAHVSAVGDIVASAQPGANTFGDGTRFSLGGTLDARGDFAGAVAVDGTSASVNIADTSNSTLTVSKMQVAERTASVTLASPQGIAIASPQLSPVGLLTVTAPNIQFNDSSQLVIDGQPGILATQGITLNIQPSGHLNSEPDPMFIHPETPSVLITGKNTASKNWWIAGNVNAEQSSVILFNQLHGASGAIYAELERFLRVMQRSDAGLLGLEMLVVHGNLPLDAVVAPLSFPSLQIREPRCLEEQRSGEAGCQ